MIISFVNLTMEFETDWQMAPKACYSTNLIANLLRKGMYSQEKGASASYTDACCLTTKLTDSVLQVLALSVRDYNSRTVP